MNSDLIGDTYKTAFDIIKSGMYNFPAFCRYMYKRYGDGIKPYLKAVYNGSREYFMADCADLANKMNSYDEVQKIDVDNTIRFIKNIDKAQSVILNIKNKRDVQLKKQSLLVWANASVWYEEYYETKIPSKISQAKAIAILTDYFQHRPFNRLRE